MSTLQIARYVVSFSWVYHGLFPKIIHIAPLEKLMTASIGFSAEISYWITKFAGAGEIIFGITLFVFYRSALLIWLNIVALAALLLFVALLEPLLLMEAFNPVTTNLVIIAMSVVWLKEIGFLKK